MKDNKRPDQSVRPKKEAHCKQGKECRSVTSKCFCDILTWRSCMYDDAARNGRVPSWLAPPYARTIFRAYGGEWTCVDVSPGPEPKSGTVFSPWGPASDPSVKPPTATSGKPSVPESSTDTPVTTSLESVPTCLCTTSRVVHAQQGQNVFMWRRCVFGRMERDFRRTPWNGPGNLCEE